MKVTTGRAADKDLAQGAHIVEFEGADEGHQKGKDCSCSCGLYRQWISGYTKFVGDAERKQAESELIQIFQQKGIKSAPSPPAIMGHAVGKAPKNYVINSCKHSLTLKEDALTEEWTSCLAKTKGRGCISKFADQPGPESKLKDGDYVKANFSLRFEIWDTCLGKPVLQRDALLTIEGDKGPRRVNYEFQQGGGP